MNNKGKKTGKTIMLIGVLFVLASLGLTAYNTIEENKAERLSAQVLSQLDMAPSVNGGQSLPDYVVNPDISLPKKEIDGKHYVGTVSIPALSLTLPVIDKWSYENFKIAPCIYEGTPYKKNMIIAAHNYRKHFASIKSLEQGDTVIFKDMDGNTFSYEVMYVEILDNNAVEEMSAGQWDLTLFTCTYGGATRITVRCMEKTKK